MSSLVRLSPSALEAAWELQLHSQPLPLRSPTTVPATPDPRFHLPYPHYALSPTLSASSHSSHSSQSSFSSQSALSSQSSQSSQPAHAQAQQHPYTQDPRAQQLTMLRRARMRLSPPQDCVPTHRLFDFDAPPSPPSPTVSTASSSAFASPGFRAATLQRHDRDRDHEDDLADDADAEDADAETAAAASKRASSSTAAGGAPAKKARTCMSTKDFVPPDVSGLSKREARLVKNRAAAFLSRQRKREEFESMEV